MSTPPSEPVLFDDAYSNLTACYQERNIAFAIGEWILQDWARQDFTYAYFNSIRNTAGQSNYYNDHGPVNISAFLPHALLLLVMIVAMSHVLHFFLRHLGQPRFVSQMIVWNLTINPPPPTLSLQRKYIIGSIIWQIFFEWNKWWYI